ncbi:MAG: nuclease-related domain-containing protein [Acidimicrobiales bacterium]
MILSVLRDLIAPADRIDSETIEVVRQHEGETDRLMVYAEGRGLIGSAPTLGVGRAHGLTEQCKLAVLEAADLWRQEHLAELNLPVVAAAPPAPTRADRSSAFGASPPVTLPMPEPVEPGRSEANGSEAPTEPVADEGTAPEPEPPKPQTAPSSVADRASRNQPPVAKLNLGLNRPGEPYQAQIDRIRRTDPQRWATLRLPRPTRSGPVDPAVGWIRRVENEKRVARVLGKLPDEWTVIHSVPVVDGVIDNLVIGPGGTFVLITGRRRRRRRSRDAPVAVFDDGDQNEAAHALGMARTAARLLSLATGMHVEVSPLVVSATSSVATGEHQVPVVDVDQLGLYLKTQPKTLSPDDAKTIGNHARWRTIWS